MAMIYSHAGREGRDPLATACPALQTVGGSPIASSGPDLVAVESDQLARRGSNHGHRGSPREGQFKFSGGGRRK